MSQLHARRRRKSIESFATQLASRRLKPSRVAALVDRMCARYKGVDGLVRVWAGELDAVLREQPGSRLALKSFEAIAWLIAAADESQREANKGIAEMSDEELERELRVMLQDFLDGQPILKPPGAV